MAQRNDDELAFYLAQAVKASGQISDEDSAYLLAQLSPYTGAAQINDLWRSFWVAAGIPNGDYAGMAYAWLVSQGIPAGSISDMWHAYFDKAYPAILDSALAWMDETTISQNLGDLTNWANGRGTGGTGFDFNVITGSIPIVQSGGKDVLSFNGTSFVRPTGLTLLTSPSRIYCVYQLTDLTTQSICRVYDSYNSSSLRHNFAINKTNGYHWMEAGVILQTPDSSITTNIEVSNADFSGIGSELLISGLTEVLGSAGTQNWNYCTLGANFAATVGQMMLGTIGEFIVFNTILPTVSEDADIFNYLRNKWGSL